MKRQIRFSSAIIGFAFLTTAVSSWGQIAGSMHDFSTRAWNTTTEMCIVCHTPHHADVSVQDAPLWNHEVTTTVFSLYSSPTLDAILSDPTASSRLCLSCHDGTVAVDSFGGRNGSEFTVGPFVIGTDLSDDHPVSFIYDALLATTDGGLHSPDTTPSGLGGTIQDDLLFNDSLECSSCHDVHNAGNSAIGEGLLRVSNAGSALCLTCHDK